MQKDESKTDALARVSSFMSCRQKIIITMNTFITSQFGYCSLRWSCRSRKILRQLYIIHERAIRIVYTDYTSYFDEPIERSGSVTIHHRNLQQLTTKIYKALNGMSSSLMSDLFVMKECNHNLRN